MIAVNFSSTAQCLFWGPKKTKRQPETQRGRAEDKDELCLHDLCSLAMRWESVAVRGLVTFSWSLVPMKLEDSLSSRMVTNLGCFSVEQFWKSG